MLEAPFGAPKRGDPAQRTLEARPDQIPRRNCYRNIEVLVLDSAFTSK